MIDLRVFDKLHIRSFDFQEFIKVYELEYINEEYGFPTLETIEAIWLEDIFVNDKFKGQGHGTKFITMLKQQGLPIVLYSLFEAEDYWMKQGFESIGDYVYTWGIDNS